MKRILGLVVLSFLAFPSFGQIPLPPITPLPVIPTPEQTGALQKFIALLEPCLEITVVVPYEGCTFPAGKYCLFYTNDPTVPPEPGSYYTFGWYPEEVGCGALYVIVRGRSYNRCDPAKFTPGPDPWAVLPCEGWGLVIPEALKRIGFWLDNPYPPTGAHPDTGGHYFTCKTRNWDGLSHAYIYQATYEWKEVCQAPTVALARCKCDCCSPAPRGTMYLIFWEDSCKGGDWDWNDFMVALIPCH